MPDSIDNYVQLSIETTGQTGSIAVLSAENVIWQRQLDHSIRTAASLAPALDEAIQWCKSHDCAPAFVSVAEGPGSFTGLRIATTTAKTLAYAAGIRLIAVDSLAAIAANVFHQAPNVSDVVVGLNAYRGQVFYGRYRREQLESPRKESPRKETPSVSTNELAGQAFAETRVLDQDDWAKILDDWAEILGSFVDGSSSDELPAFTGDEKVFRGDDIECIKQRFITRTHPDAIGVGLLGLSAAARDDFRDPLALVPKYIKLSAAEEGLAQSKS